MGTSLPKNAIPVFFSLKAYAALSDSCLQSSKTIRKPESFKGLVLVVDKRPSAQLGVYLEDSTHFS
jgi:hypothetical protein